MYFGNGQPMFYINRPTYNDINENDSKDFNDKAFFDHEMAIIKSWNEKGLEQKRQLFLKEINYLLKKDNFHKYVTRDISKK